MRSEVMGVFTSSAGVRLLVPAGPLAEGAGPVSPVRSTLAVTPAGPHAPDVPEMLQRVPVLDFRLHIALEKPRVPTV